MPMKSPLLPAIIGVATAIGITTTLDATGLGMFSALPLFVLTGVFWAVQGFTRAEVGLRWGRAELYGLALLHPLVILGTVILVALVAGATDVSNAEWGKAGLNMALGATVGILMALITEEGFFRGWLWASLKGAGVGRGGVLLWSSVAFSLWHISIVTLDTDFALPAGQIPVYLINVVVIGVIWGLMRQASGSVLVPAVCHAVWNALDYPLFGFGTNVGELGIEQTSIYGPEVGFLGLTLNTLFALVLWRWIRRTELGAGPIAR
jgi:membrane protease YdiL (CAAX protease family)